MLRASFFPWPPRRPGWLAQRTGWGRISSSFGRLGGSHPAEPGASCAARLGRGWSTSPCPPSSPRSQPRHSTKRGGKHRSKGAGS